MSIGSYQGLPEGVARGTLHDTDFFEVLLIEAAQGHLLLDRQVISLKPNTMVFITPFQKRQWFVEGNQLHARYLIFQENFLNDFFSDKLFVYRLQYFYQLKHPPALHATAALTRRFKMVYHEVEEEVVHFRCDSAHLVRSLLYFLLIRLNRDYALHYKLGTETQINNYAYRFKQLLEQHIATKQRIEEYCELVGISRVTLNKAVKTQFNLTASQLIRQRLLMEVKNYLVFSNLTVQQIAIELSFSEPAHLNRFFKQLEGMPPQQYRAAYQNGSL